MRGLGAPGSRGKSCYVARDVASRLLQQRNVAATRGRFTGVSSISPAERRWPLSARRLPAHRIVASSPPALPMATSASLAISADRHAISECRCATLAGAGLVSVPARDRNQGSWSQRSRRRTARTRGWPRGWRRAGARAGTGGHLLCWRRGTQRGAGGDCVERLPWLWSGPRASTDGLCGGARMSA